MNGATQLAISYFSFLPPNLLRYEKFNPGLSTPSSESINCDDAVELNLSSNSNPGMTRLEGEKIPISKLHNTVSGQLMQKL